jgi:hypothetical protein
MLGFFKEWAEGASKYRALQKELEPILARHGIVYRQLHPEITKLLLGYAHEQGSEVAVNEFLELARMATAPFPDMTPEQKRQQVIQAARSVNIMAKRRT